MKRKLSFSVLFTSLGFMAFAEGSTGPISLDLKVTPGTKTTLVFTDNTNTAMSMMGQDMNMVSSNNSEYVLEAKQDSAGLKSFRVVLKSSQKTMDQMGTKIDINTADPKADTTSEPTGSLTKFYKHLAGIPYTVYLNKSGKVVSNAGAKEIYNNAASKLDLTGPMAQLKSMVSESILTTDLDKAFNFNPGKTVQVGEKWERMDTIASNGMPLHFTTKYTFDKLEGDIASIKTNSTISFDGDMEAMPGASAKIMGTAVGTFKINTTTGMIVSSVGDVDMEIKLTANGMEIPMKVSSKATITAK